MAKSPYDKPSLREKLKNKVMRSTKGGSAGQWSARKAQLLAKEYEKAGGGYTTGKTKAAKSLSKWTKQDWGTGSGKNSTQGKKATGERYLPKKARDALSPQELGATNRKKREDLAKGKKVSSQPKKIAKKTSRKR